MQKEDRDAFAIEGSCEARLCSCERLWHALGHERVDVDAAVYLRLKELLLKRIALQQQSRELVGLFQHAVLHYDACA